MGRKITVIARHIISDTLESQTAYEYKCFLKVFARYAAGCMRGNIMSMYIDR